MRNFKDKLGAEWPIDVDLDFVNRVKRSCGVNVIDIVMGKIDEDLRDDLEKVGQLLWAINETEATKRSINPEGFASRFNGEAIDDAWKALSLAVADFLSPSRRELAMKIIAKGNEITTAALAKLNEKVDAVDPSKLVTMLCDGSTSSAASSASTPAT